MEQKNTLNIGTWSSRCENCGKGCDPYLKTHEINLSWSKEINGTPGCEVEFTHVTTDYLNLRENIKLMRPDLIFIDPMGG